MEEQEWERLGELGFSRETVGWYIEVNTGMPSIEAIERRYYQQGYCIYQLNLDQAEEGAYLPTGYQLTFVPYPKLVYGIYAGIDIRQLEKRIMAIDWHLARVNATSSKVAEAIAAVFSDLDKLLRSGDGEAATIALTLRSHYIFPEHNPSLSFSMHYFPVCGGLSDITLRQAYNLFCGRAVVKLEQVPGAENSLYPKWWQLENGQLVSCPDFPIGDKLRLLGIREAASEQQFDRLLAAFIQGDRALAHLGAEHSFSPVYLEADPLSGGFRFYDLKGMPAGIDSLKQEPGKNILGEKDNTALRQKKRRPGNGRNI